MSVVQIGHCSLRTSLYKMRQNMRQCLEVEGCSIMTLTAVLAAGGQDTEVTSRTNMETTVKIGETKSETPGKLKDGAVNRIERALNIVEKIKEIVAIRIRIESINGMKIATKIVQIGPTETNHHEDVKGILDVRNLETIKVMTQMILHKIVSRTGEVLITVETEENNLETIGEEEEKMGHHRAAQDLQTAVTVEVEMIEEGAEMTDAVMTEDEIKVKDRAQAQAKVKCST